VLAGSPQAAVHDHSCRAAQGQFQNAFPELLNAEGYAIGDSSESGDGSVTVEISVSTKSTEKDCRFAFVMRQKDVGRNRGCWMTKTVMRLP
jgi:hypothetical protein